MFDVIEHTKEEWRDLGFYYELDKEANEWRIVGSRDGVLSLSKILRAYADRDRNEIVGEHDHFGPYSYFTLVTAESPQITHYGIFGSPADFLRLADFIEWTITQAQPAETIFIDQEYSPNNSAVLRINLKPDGFDPSEADDFKWVKT